MMNYSCSSVTIDVPERIKDLRQHFGAPLMPNPAKTFKQVVAVLPIPEGNLQATPQMPSCHSGRSGQVVYMIHAFVDVAVLPLEP
jgi:hypothetical protein